MTPETEEPVTDDSQSSCDGGCIGGIFAAIAVLALVFLAWLSGWLVRIGCPSPLKKPRTEKPTSEQPTSESTKPTYHDLSTPVGPRAFPADLDQATAAAVAWSAAAPNQLADIRATQAEGAEPGAGPSCLSSASSASTPVDFSRTETLSELEEAGPSLYEDAEADDDDATAAHSYVAALTTTPESKMLTAKALGKQPIAHEGGSISARPESRGLEDEGSSDDEPKSSQLKWLATSELQAVTASARAAATAAAAAVTSSASHVTSALRDRMPVPPAMPDTPDPETANRQGQLGYVGRVSQILRM